MKVLIIGDQNILKTYRKTFDCWLLFIVHFRWAGTFWSRATFSSDDKLVHGGRKLALNALKWDKIKDSRYAILSVCVGHVEILENDEKARLPWSLKNGGNGARGILADMPTVLAWDLGTYP